MNENIGPYHITGELGRGGMGVVYRATDTRLGRDVAVKALPEDFAADPTRLERFEREAKTLAQVSSQHIAGIYGVEEDNGQRYIVMELVEGETLADRLDRGPIPADEALEFADQIAAGVEAAHEAGVIHRDLKPANIRVTPEGKVKVLDFGLARNDEGQTSTGLGSSQLVTATTPQQHTTAGAVLGTAAYMSPEQARGRRVDKRTDIWAFGVVLYEMLTGASPFAGETATDSIGAVLHKDPELGRLPPDVAPGVVRVLARCLERDKGLRYRDIGDVRIELQRAQTEPAVAAPTKRGVAPALAVLVALVLGTLGLAAGWFGSPKPVQRELRVSIAAPDGLQIGPPRLSPDGSSVFVAAWPLDGGPARLFHRRLDEREWTEPTGMTSVRNGAYSPDGLSVAIVGTADGRGASNQLYVYKLDSKLPPTAVSLLPDSISVSGYEFEWLGPDAEGHERVVFADGRDNLFRLVDLETGSLSDPIPVDTGDYKGTLELIFDRLDASRVLCCANRYSSTAYFTDLCLLDVDKKTLTVLVENASEGTIGPDGSLLFTRGDTLCGATFDPVTLEVGSTVQLVAGLRASGVGVSASFSVAGDGTIAYRPGGVQGAERHIGFFTPDGGVTYWPGEPRAYIHTVKLSPDVSRLLTVIAAPNAIYEIWGSEIDDPRLRRVRAPTGIDVNYPVFAPDGDTFLYMIVDPEQNGVRVEAASFDGSFEPRPITSVHSGVVYPMHVHPSGDRVLLGLETDQGYRLCEAPLDGSGDAEPILSPEFNAVFGHYSPDGSMLAYASDETGRREVYVRHIRGPGSFGRPIPVTSRGGGWAQWQEDADGVGPFTLYTGNNQDSYLAYEITPGDRPTVGEGVTVGYDPGNIGTGFGNFLADGRLVRIARGSNEKPAERAELILNWYDRASRLIHGR